MDHGRSFAYQSFQLETQTALRHHLLEFGEVLFQSNQSSTINIVVWKQEKQVKNENSSFTLDPNLLRTTRYISILTAEIADQHLGKSMSAKEVAHFSNRKSFHSTNTSTLINVYLDIYTRSNSRLKSRVKELTEATIDFWHLRYARFNIFTHVGH